jgi:hypothetical protein
MAQGGGINIGDGAKLEEIGHRGHAVEGYFLSLAPSLSILALSLCFLDTIR